MEEVTYTGTLKQIKAKVSFMRDEQGVFDLIVKPHRNKRSRDANAYMWALIVKIADALRESKEAVYVRELMEYGQSDILELRSDADPKRFFKYFDIIGEVKHDGVLFRQVKVYKPSSEMDSREMAVLLDGVIADAEAQGIPTLTQEQVDRMKGAWGK